MEVAMPPALEERLTLVGQTDVEVDPHFASLRDLEAVLSFRVKTGLNFSAVPIQRNGTRQSCDCGDPSPF